MSVIVSGTLMEKEGKYLLIRQNGGHDKGKWWIPAGTLEDGEYVLDTAIRETFEESGYNVKLSGILGLYNKIIRDKTVMGIIFKGDIVSGNLNFNPEEISDARWFTYDEILEIQDELRSKEALLRCLQNAKNNNVILLDDFIKIN